MTDEQLEKYYDVKRKYNGCILANSQCPLKNHCNGLVRDKCREYVPSEYHWVVDDMIQGYHESEESEFVRKYINGDII
jgi:hypothetical protein